MILQRAESVASSAAGHGLESLKLVNGALGSDNEQDDFLQPPSLESGVFGVLFTLSQEKNQQHIYYHWILLKILLDAWQLYTTIMTPEMGWNIDTNSITWKCISVLSFGWLKDLGYTWYIAVLYSMAGLLAMNLVLCVWVAWSFKEQKFDYVWPIKVVRGFSYVFIQVFDITSLNFLQLGISCNYVGSAKPHLHMSLFPQYSCASAPHIIHGLVSGLLLLLFVVVAMVVNMSEVDVSPTSKSPQALGHSGAEVTAFGIKALLTLVGVFLGWPKVAAVAYCVLTAWLAWEYLRWVPHLLIWVNCLKGGVAVTMLGVATLQMAIVLLPHGPVDNTAARKLTLVMMVGLGPLFMVGSIATFVRTRLFMRTVVNAFRNANYEMVKPQDIFHFAHPRDVEIAARCARVWTDLYTLEKTAVHRAEEMIKAGIALFPDSAFIALVYANFMLDMLGFSQTGVRQLESARKLNPGLMCRFMLFVRQQQATQKAASSTVGKGGNMDLLGYVEYQRKQRMVLRHHKDALQAMANFWRILGSSSISFSSLSKSLEEIDTSITQAETAYRVVLEMYNHSPRLVRLYARFLETIKQDPWTAAQYYAAAERLEERKDEDGQGPTLPDGTPLSRMDDVEKGVLVVNAFGDIQVANRKLHNMFGYKKGDLDGKNVTVLMPPHEAKRHPAILRHYIDSGDKAAPYFRHPVLAVHRERVAFTLRIAVSRASGLGEDSVFIGLLESLPAAPGTGRVWVTTEGIIVCCDPGFVTCFGYHPDDVIGVQLDKLLCTGGAEVDRGLQVDVWMANKFKHDNQEYVQKLLASAFDYGSAAQTNRSACKSNLCSVLHKYDFAKEVSISVLSDMTKSNIYEVRMELVSNEPQLLMVVERKGAIRHMSGDLAKVLGVGPVEALQDGSQGGGSNAPHGDYNIAEDHVMVELKSDGLQRSLDDFLPKPWNTMHYKYRKYVKGGSPNLSGAWGCRAVSDTSSSTGPTMRLVGLHGRPVFVHMALSSRDHQGEITHVIRMTRSSKETAIAERRLRIRITVDGVVQEIVQPIDFQATNAASAVASNNTDAAASSTSAGGVVSQGGLCSELFGFPADQLLGCKLWDFLSLASQPLTPMSIGPRPSQAPLMQTQQAQQVLLQQQLLNRELTAEVDAFIRVSTGTGGDASPYGIGEGGCETRNLQASNNDSFGNNGSRGGLDLRMLDSMITSTLQTPGVSWRVCALPPSAGLEAATMSTQERAAAVLARRVKQAILRLDVSLPSPGAEMTHGLSGGLVVFAELWAADAVTGVLEINGSGKVSGILEEDVRPAGLLFGLPREDVMGAPLGALLRLQPGQSAVGMLTDSGYAKKSALKASSGNKKGKMVDKVGPVHIVEGFHRDHQQLQLTVQVVGKVGAGNPVIAVIRFASPKATDHCRLKSLNTPMAGASGGSFKPQQPQQSPPMHTLNVNETVRLREASFSLSNNVDPEAQLQMARAALRSSGAMSVRSMALPWKAPSVNGARGQAQGGLVDGDGTRSLLLGGTLSAASMTPKCSRMAGSTSLGVAAAAAQPAFPGFNAEEGDALELLGVKGAQTLQKADGSSGSDACDDIPRVTGTILAAAAAIHKIGTSSPLKPDSPSPAAPDPARRQLSDGIPRASVDLASRAELEVDRDADRIAVCDDKRPPRTGAGGGKEGSFTRPVNGKATLVSAITDMHGEGDSGQQDGVNKWVTSGGEYYRNRSKSLAEAEFEDEDEEDNGSFGPATHAISSQGMSPTDSKSFGAEVTGDGMSGGVSGGYGMHLHHRQNGHHLLPPGGLGLVSQGGGHRNTPSALQRSAAVETGDGDGESSVGEPHPTGHGSGGAVDPPDELVDDRSDGGESAYSGISGISGISDSETPADFKHGKRYRKLVKLMDSPEAQRTVVRMKYQTALIMLAAGAIHIVCFALVISAVKKQSAALDNMALAGHTQFHLQRILVETRALDQAYKGKGSNTTYTAADIQILARAVMEDCEEFRTLNNHLLEALPGNSDNLYYSRVVEVWSGINATTQLPFYESIALWDMVTRIFVSAKAIFQTHAEWATQGIALSSTLAGAFILNSGQALIPGVNEVLHILLELAVQRTENVNMLQLTFLMMEGFLVTCASAVFLTYILRCACVQRYQLYETFLTIPVGLTRALASQTTHLLDDDETDDEDDDGGSQVDNVEEGGAMASKRKTLFEDAGGGGGRGSSTGGPPNHGPGSGGGNARRNSINSDSGMRDFYLNGILRGINAVNGGSTGGGGRLRRGSGSVSNSASGSGGGNILKGNRQSYNALAPASSGRMRASEVAGSFSTKHYSLASMTDTGSQQQPLPNWLGRFFTKIWRPNSVSPLQSTIPSAPGMHDITGLATSRRTLVRNSRIPQATLLFIGTYSLLIILFYSLSYGILMGVKDMVALQGVSDHSTERAYRTVFFAQELAAEENITNIPARVRDLRKAAIALRDSYYTLKMGDYAWTSVDPNMERFVGVHGQGSVKETSAMFDLFYADHQCLRLPENLPCPDSNHQFFQIVTSGVDAMTMQLLLELSSMANQAEAAVAAITSSGGTGGGGGNGSSEITLPNLNSSQWNFIYNVGTVDLFDGNQRIVIQHITDIRQVFKVIVVLHVVLFLLLLGVFLAFSLVIYLPLLRRMSREKRRIAEMMSQLPTELDVMKLVSTALVGSKPGSGQPQHRHRVGAGSTSHRVGRLDTTGKASALAASGTLVATAVGAVDGAVIPPNEGMGYVLPAGSAVGGGLALNVEQSTAVESGGIAYQAWKGILNRATSVTAGTAAGAGNGQSRRSNVGSRPLLAA